VDHLRGYAGNILRVDLSTARINRIPTEDYVDRFLGGRGFAAKIYWDEVPHQIDSFDPENRLIFVTGPVTAATGFAGSRWQVCGKSPIHNQFSYCNLGGAWGAQLKLAGYDGLVVYGKADELTYLWISNDAVEIRKANHLKGKGAISCREELKEELGKSARVVAIGPAGENRVAFASLLADSDSSGSSGLGAVMGSKNLKAIAVNGKKRISVADPAKIQELKERVRDMIKEISVARISTFPPERLKDQVCYDCIGGCIRKSYQGESGKTGKFICHSSLFYTVRAQRYYGKYNDVPFEANKLCDDYGLDSYGVDTLMMWLIRCYKAKILTDEQIEIPLSKVGSLEFIKTLIEKVSNREGFGDVLANGTRKAAEILGSDSQKLITDFMTRTGYLHVYGARMYITTGLFHAMEPRLPIQQLHEISMPALKWAARESGIVDNNLTSDVMRAIAGRFWGSELAADFSTYEGKALAAAMIQDREYAKESLILCDFIWPIFYTEATHDRVGDPTLESQLCAAVTGKNIDEQGLYKIGERVFNLQRAILTREGRRGREYDSLEDFDYNIPLKSDFGNPGCIVPGKDGKAFSRKGMVVDRKKFEKMKDEYYAIRDWDVSTGLQKKDKLKELNLGEVVQGLESEGLLT